MSYNLEDAYIIGITGRQGKTSVAYLVHKYLQSIGKKSILYSSALVDSPCGNWAVDTGFEFTYKNTSRVVQILHEAVAYEAEFIIIECWEQSLLTESVTEIPFDLKVLTKFYYSGNGHRGAEMVYQNKLKFFQNEEDSKCLINVVNYEEPYYSQMARFVQEMNASNVVLMDSNDRINNCSSRADYENYFNTSDKYAEHREQFKVDDIKYSVNSSTKKITGSEASIYVNGTEINVSTPLISSYHVENITTTLAILNEADVLDIDAFKEFISDPDLDIPGRMETVEWRDRTIIIDGSLTMKTIKLFSGDAPLKTVSGYKVVNSIANGFARAINPDRRIQDGLQGWDGDPLAINQHADYAYVTVGGIGNFTADYLTDTYASKLTVPHEIILDRKEAIKKALTDSKAGDIICILRRGSERIFIKTYNTFEFFTDRELVEEVIDEIENSEEDSE